eukprot:199560_1
MRVRKAAEESSSPSPFLPLVKLILVLLILLLLPDLVTSRRRGGNSRNKRKKSLLKRAYGTVKIDCILECDRPPTNMAENEMCITECISPVCHQDIYFSKELELGEVDEVRGVQFESCAKESMRKEVAEKRQAAKELLKNSSSS